MNQYLLNAFSIIIQKIKCYDYISQRKNNIDEEEKNGNSIKKSFPLNKKQFFNLFNKAKKLNGMIILLKGKIILMKKKKMEIQLKNHFH